MMLAIVGSRLLVSRFVLFLLCRIVLAFCFSLLLGRFAVSVAALVCRVRAKSWLLDSCFAEHLDEGFLVFDRVLAPGLSSPVRLSLDGGTEADS